MIECMLTPGPSPGCRTQHRGATPACGEPWRSSMVQWRSLTCHSRNSAGRGLSVVSSVLPNVLPSIAVLLEKAQRVARPEDADGEPVGLDRDPCRDAEDVAQGV